MFVNIDPYTKIIRLWLFTMLLLVILIIVIGGLTRLTGSGLSITEWELFKGILPPLNNDRWIFYFNEYKKIPEFKSINFNMNLEEFKIIFYWEYFHRLVARLIGIFSFIPLFFLYFKHRDKFKKDLKYFSIFLLVCFQGFLGWFMVQSGLIKNLDISHFRLAVHLSVALLILSLIFWFILDNLKIRKYIHKINNNFIFLIFIIIIFQIILGAFMAGLNGGLLYNTWPDMNGHFIPTDTLISDLYNIESLSNASIIQFYHRLLAYIMISLVIILNYIFYKKRISFKSINFFNLAILIQFILGILTLLTGVKIYYASLHQLGSVLVLTSFLFIYYKNTN